MLMYQYKYVVSKHSIWGENAAYVWNGTDWIRYDDAFPPITVDGPVSMTMVWDDVNNNVLFQGDYGFRGNPADPACDPPGVTIWMPAHFFGTGDTCACAVNVCNPNWNSWNGYPLFVILDLAGHYYFAPDFIDYDNYLDRRPYFEPGNTEITVLGHFPWPDNAGSFTNACFWAGVTDPGISTIIGEMDCWEFSW